MTGTLLAMPVIRAVDSGGAPISGALLQFYLTTTTTPAGVYGTATLSTPLANPVVADAGGLFAPIYLDPAVTYRAQLQTSGGTVIRDLDPVSLNILEASAVQVNAGVATGVYVSPARLAGWTGVAAALGYAPLNRAGDTATNLLIGASAPATTSAGYLGLPVNEQDGAFVLALGDAGKLVRHNSAAGHAHTIPPNASVAYPVGTAIAFRNYGAGVLTVTRGAGVTLTIAGSGASKDVAVAQYGFGTAVLEAPDIWVISGVGLS